MRRALVALSAAALAAGGMLGGGLAMPGPAKISLSASSNGWHKQRTPKAMEGKSRSASGGRVMAAAIRQRRPRVPRPMARRMFTTLDDNKDPTFNQLLGINNRGKIAGYFGSGAAGHPNKGYVLVLAPHMSSYRDENVPGSAQTQVTGLNDIGMTVGFWSSQNTASMTDDNFAFYAWGNHFHTVRFPTGYNATPPVNQLLGVNDFGMAVGFYTNRQGSNRGYEYNIHTRQFRRVLVPGAPSGKAGPSLTAAAINNRGDVVGFYTVAGGVTDGFLKRRKGGFTRLAYPGATMTQAFGVNDRDEVVGAYATGSGSAAKTFGFTWTPRNGFASVSAPQGPGATTVNGVNDAGDLVGFYTDAAGNTHGLLVEAVGGHLWQPTPTAMPSPAGSSMAGSSMATPTAQPDMTPTAAPSASGMPPSPSPSPSSTSGPGHW